MSPYSETSLRNSVEAADAFVTWYYDAINKGKPVAPGYVNANKTYTAANHPPATITVNGLTLSSPEEWDKLLEQQRTPQLVIDPSSSSSTNKTSPTGPASTTNTSTTTNKDDKKQSLVTYDVDLFDVHIANYDYIFAAPEELIKKYNKHAGVRMMLTVTAAGTVTFGLDKESPQQRFCETFILVPNWEVIARAGSKATRRYIISAHSYRAF